MSTKDWILLLVPIFCNGIIVFLLQRAFERKQLIQDVKYEYVEIMRQKVDCALEACDNLSRSNTRGLPESEYYQEFVNCYCNVFYYYRQNEMVFKKLKKDMLKLSDLQKRLQEEQHKVSEPNDEVIASNNMKMLFHKINELLQSVQNKCIQRKI